MNKPTNHWSSIKILRYSLSCMSPHYSSSLFRDRHKLFHWKITSFISLWGILLFSWACSASLITRWEHWYGTCYSVDNKYPDLYTPATTDHLMHEIYALYFHFDYIISHISIYLMLRYISTIPLSMFITENTLQYPLEKKSMDNSENNLHYDSCVVRQN